MTHLKTAILLLFICGVNFAPAQVLVDWNAQWSYFKGVTEPSQPGNLWREYGFNDSGWPTGNAPFSYGEDAEGTKITDMVGNFTTLYLRKEFIVDDVDFFDEFKFSVDYDDGFALWINGTLTLQQNTTGTYTFNQGTPNSHESGEFESFSLTKTEIALVKGVNVIAVQGFNISKNSNDFFIDVRLEGIKKLPETTPANCNISSGFFDKPFVTEISTEGIGQMVKYTLDGSDPRYSSSAITAFTPVSVTIDPGSTAGGRGKTGGVVLRASRFETGFDPSKPFTRTYLFISNVITQTHPGGLWPSGSVNGQVIDLAMDATVTTDVRYRNLMDDALLDLPSISVVTDPANLFNSQTGIYVNAAYRGQKWERPASIELINPDKSPGFNVDAGIRIRGGWSRHDEFAKHAFRLFFRSDYGEKKLRFPLFGDEGVDEFDKVDLRTSQNYSWSKGGEEAVHCTMNRDVFSRDCQKDMHQLYTRSRYYHLYLNGAYWGIYQTQERADADFAESYMGGDPEDYDVIKVNIDDNYNTTGIEATDGTTDAWENIWNMCQQGFSSNADYFRLIGCSPAGEPDTSLQVWVDIDNLIDYMLVIFYTGNFDSPVTKFSGNYNPNNFYSVFNRNDKREGFKFLAHDAEHTLLTDPIGPGIGLNENRVNIATTSPVMNVTSFSRFQPQWLHYKLTQNEEYRIRFADRVYRHFFNQGVFVPDNNVKRFRSTSDQLELAIIAESARWGDQGSRPARTKDKDWIPAVNRVVNDYMPFRTGIVLKQLMDQNLCSGLKPPVFRNNSTVITVNELTIPADYDLLIENPNQSGSIVYTTDGSDPRAVGGGKSAFAAEATNLKSLLIRPGTYIKARTRYMSGWSALAEIYFQDARVFTDLKITELNYHPEDRVNMDGKNLEFIELKNTGSTTIDLSGLSFTDGINFSFPAGSKIPPGSFIVIASFKPAFAGMYGFSPDYEFSGNLSNSGEKITLVTQSGRIVFSFTYSDLPPWPEKADGDGYSLVSVEKNPAGNPGSPAYWTISKNKPGSPGAEDLMSSPERRVIAANNSLNPEVYPNPALSVINAGFSLNAGGKTEIGLRDLNGRYLCCLLNEFVPSGKHRFSFPLDKYSLHAGIYLIEFRTGDSVATKKIMVAK